MRAPGREHVGLGDIKGEALRRTIKNVATSPIVSRNLERLAGDAVLPEAADEEFVDLRRLRPFKPPHTEVLHSILSAKRKSALDALERGSIVEMEITSVRSDSLLTRLLKVCSTQLHARPVLALRCVAPLNIMGVCPAAEVPSSDFSTPLTSLCRFRPGDAMRAVVVKVNPHNQVVTVSLTKAPSSAKVTLGTCERPNVLSQWEEPPIPDQDLSGSQHGIAFPTPLPCTEALKHDEMLDNPYGLESLLANLGMSDHCSLVTEHTRDDSLSFEELRARQNQEWARKTVLQGVAFAKEKRYDDAMKRYKQALEVDPRHRDAFVAIGALYANTNRLEAAAREFERALKIDPEDANARLYLSRTREKLQRNTGSSPSSLPSPSTGNGPSAAGMDEEVAVRARMLSLLEEDERKRKKKKRRKKEKQRQKSKSRRESASSSKNHKKRRKSRGSPVVIE